MLLPNWLISRWQYFSVCDSAAGVVDLNSVPPEIRNNLIKALDHPSSAAFWSVSQLGLAASWEASFGHHSGINWSSLSSFIINSMPRPGLGNLGTWQLAGRSAPRLSRAPVSPLFPPPRPPFSSFQLGIAVPVLIPMPHHFQFLAQPVPVYGLW